MFVKSQEFKSVFDGQEVRATLLPLKLETLLEIEDSPSKVELVRRFAAEVPNYVTNFSLSLNGEAVTVEEVATYAYFAKLLTDLGQVLVASARPANPSMPAEPSAG